MKSRSLPGLLILFVVWVLIALVDIWVDIIDTTTFWKATISVIVVCALIWFVALVTRANRS